MVDGFLNVEFDLPFREKTVSVDTQLLGEMNQQTQLIEKLMARMDEMENKCILKDRVIEYLVGRVEELERTSNLKLMRIDMLSDIVKELNDKQNTIGALEMRLDKMENTVKLQK